MKIAVLLSGGVDSSVALKLLKEQGHDITAFYLKIWLEDEISFLGDCPWDEDLKYVREICEKEQIPLEIVPLQREYFENVVSYTIEEIKEGRTPNPDMMCNNHIKFGFFLQKVDPNGDRFDKVASGHYAQMIQKNGDFVLKQAPDPVKDQTYFLARLSKEQLKKIIFPIGEFTKEEVRSLAQKYDLPNKDRKDSQGICFLGKLQFKDFVKHYLGEKTGDLIEFETSKKIGEHNGFWFYTIGQRQGICLPDGPWYVVAKDSKKNLVYVSKHYHEPDKNRDHLTLTKLNWFTSLPTDGENLKIKLRHGPKLFDCQVNFENTENLQVILSENDQGIASGQFGVLYKDGICLGSGVIV